MAYQPSSSTFTGSGIQNGAGSVSVGRDVNIHQSVHSDKSAAFLSKLPTTDPRLDKKRIETVKGGLLDGCCDWILHHGDFTSWRDRHESQLLWIRDDPGKGKTMLVCGIIDHLQEKIREEGSHASLAYFFFQATDERINTATSALRSLSHTLLMNDQAAQEQVLAKFGNRGDSVFTDINRWFALCDAVKTILDSDPSRQVFLLLDALDECTEQLEELLEHVVKLPRDNVRVLVSSRNWPEIDSGLRQCPVQTALRLELNKNSVSQAVDWYISKKVEDLAKKKRLDQDTRMIAERYLRDGADDTFLWVSLVCQELSKLKITKWNFLANLKSFPSGLESFYDRMLDTLASQDHSELLRDVIAIMSLAYRPLKLGELSSLVKDHQQYPCEPEFWQETVESCGSLLVVLSDNVFFVHQSSRDYTQRLFETGYFSRTVAQQHGIIAHRALLGISEILHEDMYGLGSPGYHIRDIDPSCGSPLDRFQYSCVYWVEHTCDAFGDASNDDRLQLMSEDGRVRTFIKLHFLHWLESLSLLRVVHSAIASLAKLARVEKRRQTAAQNEADSTLFKLLLDGLEYVRYFSECIESYPIQLYTCAPLFTPSESLVGRFLHRRRPRWMQHLPKPRREWRESQRIITPKFVAYSFAVSPSGERLAIGGRHRLSVWDLITDLKLQEYQVSKQSLCVTSVAFSETENILAAGTSSGEVIVYDMNTRESLPLGCTEALICHISFADCGRLLLAASPRNAELGIWKLEKASEKSSLLANWSLAIKSGGRLRPEPCRLCAVSPDSVLVACVSLKAEQYVEIWNTLTWVCESTLPQSGKVVSVSFSPDSTTVAIVSYRGTRLPQILQIQSLTRAGSGDEGRSYKIKGLEEVSDWSPDGHYLLLKFYTKSALFSLSNGAIWSGQLGRRVRTQRFFKDGGTVISIPRSGTAVDFWTTPSTRDSITVIYRASVKARVVTISPDHEFMVVKSEEAGVFWVQSIPGQQQWLQLQIEALDGVRFLGGGGSPVLSSFNNTDNVWIWRKTEGQACREFDVGGMPLHIAASTDCMTFGAMTCENRIKLWNGVGEAIHWEMPQELQGLTFMALAIDSANKIGLLTEEGHAVICSHSGSLVFENNTSLPDVEKAAIAFSPCGNLLAAGYRRHLGNFVLKVWESVSGKFQVIESLSLPIIYQWPEQREARSASWAVLRMNFTKVEIIWLSQPRQAALRHVQSKPDWLCLEEQPVLWLPPEWRPLDAVDPQYSMQEGGWAGTVMPLIDRNGHYMDICLSTEYLAGESSQGP